MKIIPKVIVQKLQYLKIITPPSPRNTLNGNLFEFTISDVPCTNLVQHNKLMDHVSLEKQIYFHNNMDPESLKPLMNC